MSLAFGGQGIFRFGFFFSSEIVTRFTFKKIFRAKSGNIVEDLDIDDEDISQEFGMKSGYPVLSEDIKIKKKNLSKVC